MSDFNFFKVFSRVSTWLGMLAAAAATALGFYESMPAFMQGWVPHELLAAIIFLAGIAIPGATSYKQRGIAKATGMRPTK